MTIAAFALAVVTLLAAHVVRTMRWRAILKMVGIETSNLQPLAALSTGYLINAVVPFRLGELVRGAYLAYAVKANPVTVLATIVFERATDLFAVAILALLLSPFGHSLGLAAASATGGVVVIGLILLLERSRLLRRLAWLLASIFNDGLKTALLHFLQNLSELGSARSLLLGPRFLALTALMWLAYMASLALFALAIGDSFFNQFLLVYGAPLSGTIMAAWNTRSWLLGLYLLLPIAAVIGFAALSGFNIWSRLRGTLRWATRLETLAMPSTTLRAQSFRSEAQYGAFLDRRFGGGGGLLSAFEARGLGEGVLHRVFTGGSGAITALVEIGGHLRVRKFATGDTGARLLVQRDWLARHAEALPLVELMAGTPGGAPDGADQLYDMAYLGGSRDLYEAVHSETLAASSALIADIVARIDGFHAGHGLDDADDGVVGAYVERKAVDNFAALKAALPEMFEREAITVNGRPFAVGKLTAFASPDWLAGQLTDRRQARIHGDLTVENVMVGGGEPGWFLIDPNPVNGFESPLIDFAKLMQSLHLGYEAVHRDPRAGLVEGRLNVILHRSLQYDALFGQVLAALIGRFGEAGARQVFLHEMINYLRLIPYQFRRSHTAGLAFFGCLCLLVDDFEQRYPGEWPC